jgi:ketosteroid isomerase-like protein
MTFTEQSRRKDIKAYELMQETKALAALETIREINRIWSKGQVDNLSPLVHPEMVMVFPGFAGRSEGREQFLAGFRDFCENATLLQFTPTDYQADVVGDTAVITFEYELLYERTAERYRASGRDLWVFQQQDGNWIAVWRTMLDLREQNA